MIHKYLSRGLVNILIISILASVVSCIPQKKLRYLQSVEDSQIDTANSEQRDLNYHLKPNDEVYIQVYSVDPKTYLFFNRGGMANANSNYLNNEVGLYLNSYTITDSGFVAMPIVGKVYLAGKTLEDAQREVESRLKEYLTEVSVVLKLSGFRVTLIGEVKRPGRYTAYVSRLNIFEALALSGDMTSYGNRKKVMLIRKEDNREHIYTLNLLDENIVHSEYYYLLPNDIVYVESLNAKTWGFEQFPYVLILSTITTFIALMSLIRTF